MIPGRTQAAWGPYSPVPNFPPKLEEACLELIIRPALKEMVRRGTPFRGILFAGLMLTEEGREADRVQCAVRRSGMPGSAAPHEVRPVAGAAGGLRRGVAGFRPALE